MSVKHNIYTVTTKNVAEDKVRFSLSRSFKCPFHRFTAWFLFFKTILIRKKYFNEQGFYRI